MNPKLATKMISTKKDNIYRFLMKYRHGLFLCYMFLYFPWFIWLEKNVTATSHFHVIHMAVDDRIPFIEYFIVPYLLWFAYVAAAVLYFLFRNKEDFTKLCIFLFTGMTVFLLISTFYPNGHYLRPVTFERDNIFIGMVRQLYATDTPTNLFPSIHVYNSIGVNLAIWHSADLKDKNWLKAGSAVLMVSIVLSTVFLKQHSMFDVITAIVMACFLYSLVYTRHSLKVSDPALEERVRHV